MRTGFNLFMSLFLCFALSVGPLAIAQEDAPPEDVVEASENDEATDEAAPQADTEEAGDEVDADAKADEPETAPEDAKALETDAEALEVAVSLVKALEGQQWPLAVGLLLALAVYGVNRFALKGKVPEKVVPWISFGVAVASSTSTGILAGNNAFESFTAGMIAGTVAVGGWEAVLKHMIKPITESTGETKKANDSADEPKS